MNIAEQKQMCKEVRKDILEMIHKARSGHPGGSLSAVELMVPLYFGGIMNVRPDEPEYAGRDRFILSKGHACPLIYSVLGRMSFFPTAWFDTLRQLGSHLQGHPNASKVPGMDCSAGSLGQGLSISVGLAMGLKKQGIDARVYCLMGDGELQEGQIWEAAMTAAHYKVDNVCGIVDWNHVQLDGTVEEIMNIGNLVNKWKDFGWNVIECDGHDVEAVTAAYEKAKECKGMPSVILAHTVKGKGVSFMENDCAWHGTAPNDEQLAAALAEVLA